MSEDRRRLLYKLFDELPADHLDAVIAREIDELPFEDIAAAFEKPYSTVYGYYQAGIREMRAAYERWKARQRNGGALLLPISLEALLETDRTAPPPPAPAAEVERAWRRVQQALGDAGPADSPPASGPRRIHVPRTMNLTLTLPVIGYLLAGQPHDDAGRDAAAHGDDRPASVVQSEITAATAAADRVASMSTAPASDAPGALPHVPASAASAAHGPPARLAPSSTRRTDGTALSIEQGMLEKARSAYITGNMQGAITALEEYARKYPGGLYARERDRMWIEALVGLGRIAEACQRAESFRRAYPNSPSPMKHEPLCR